MVACADCSARVGTGPKGPGASAMMLPRYVDAYGNERFWAQDRGHFGARPFGGMMLGSLGAVDAAFGLAVSIGSLLAGGLTPNAETLRAFQQAVGITADGVYGSQTRDALVRVLSATSEGRAIANRIPSAGGGGGGGGGAQPGTGLAPPVTTSPGILASLPDWAPWAAGAVLLGVAGGVVWWKLKKRGRR